YRRTREELAGHGRTSSYVGFGTVRPRVQIPGLRPAPGIARTRFMPPQSRYGGNRTRHRIDSESRYLSSLRPASERSWAICSPPIDAGASKPCSDRLCAICSPWIASTDGGENAV